MVGYEIMDPIGFIIKVGWDLLVQLKERLVPPDDISAQAVFIVGLINAIILFWLSVVRPIRSRERQFSAFSVTMMARISDLLPAYNQAVGDYSAAMLLRVQDDIELRRLSASLPDQFRMGQEFCKYDLGNEERILALIPQLSYLKSQVAKLPTSVVK